MTPTPEQLIECKQRFDRDGYVVLESLIAPAHVERLKEALLSVEAHHGFGYAKTSFEGLKTVRINNLLAYDEAFWDVPLQPSVLALAESLLDRELLLSSLCSLTMGPGQTAQPLHEDTQQLALPRPRPPLAVNAMWALSDFTEANGATRIVPGSHKLDHAPAYGIEVQTVAATMPAGSVMLFDSALWHKGGANTTDERRYALSCYYCAGWMRQQENLLLGIPRETAAKFPRRLQELCGYGIYKGQYGHIENNDPIELLGQEGRPTVWEATDRKLQRRQAQS
ncbi:MAG: phytanoyl-CoA dioxygenase family protein [Advenella sp.]|uniref:phytanoyl-CoA dioxygenase family protein n=1 Tax=unclassified Advenella TaxID=2685285 RepID=UPI001867DF15|nr:phytanoyl-CoA dioxygenase family protein [Advenella sp. FME57]